MREKAGSTIEKAERSNAMGRESILLCLVKCRNIYIEA